MGIKNETSGSSASQSSAGSKLGAKLGKTLAKSKVGHSVGRIARASRTYRSSSSSSGTRRSGNHHGSGGSGSSRGNSGSNRSRSGGGNGGFNPTPAPKPRPIPSINAFLAGDSTYQGALSGQKRTLADYLSELARRRTEAGTQYNQTRSSMMHDRDQQLSDLKDEFASRGLIQSGLYADEQGKFQKQFTDQLNALGQQQNGLLADLLSQQNNYQRENDLALQQAKQEALARRAAAYNIGA